MLIDPGFVIFQQALVYLSICSHRKITAYVTNDTHITLQLQNVKRPDLFLGSMKKCITECTFNHNYSEANSLQYNNNKYSNFSSTIHRLHTHICVWLLN